MIAITVVIMIAVVVVVVVTIAVVIAVMTVVVVVVTTKYTKPKDVSDSHFFPPPMFPGKPLPEATRFGRCLCRDKQRGGTNVCYWTPESASQSRACPSRLC